MAAKETHINCIIKPDRESPHEHITHIGNNAEDWLLTREAAIRRINSGEEFFYTIDTKTGKKMFIRVVIEYGKDPYLRTHADGKFNDNLLAQETCDASCTIIA